MVPSAGCNSTNSAAKTTVLTTPIELKRTSWLAEVGLRRGRLGRPARGATPSRRASRLESRHTPRRSAVAVATTSTRESGSSTQSTGTSWMRRPLCSARTSSSVSKNQPSSSTSGSEAPGDVGPHGLEAALRVARTRCAGSPAEDQVVGAGDGLALGAPHHPRARGEPGPDGDVAVARQQGRDEGQQGVEVGRQVDVHVGDDGRLARRPRGPQRPAPALVGRGGWPARPSSSLARRQAMPHVRSVLALSAMVISHGSGKLRSEVRAGGGSTLRASASSL